MVRGRTSLVLAGVLLAGLALRRVVERRRTIDLAGRVVLITGGSRGLGLALARRFAARGAKLALIARSEGELMRAAAELIARGAHVISVRADVRDRAEVARAVGEVVARYGRLDVVVNNAGVIAVGPLVHMTIDDYVQAMAVHYWGALYTVLAALPHLERSHGARIVNIASIGGTVAVPHLAPYTASKFALVGLSDALRAELAGRGIRVTTVVPGLMRTGSPVNATFKGRHGSEYAWFALGDSLPLLSTRAEDAARAIVDACARGDETLIIGLATRLAAAAQGLMPTAVAIVAAAVARLLPAPARVDGSQPRQGFETTGPAILRVVEGMSRRAVMRHNQAAPALPISNR